MIRFLKQLFCKHKMVHEFGVGNTKNSSGMECLKCKKYSIKVVNEKGGTAKICNAKINDPRIIVDLDAPKCTDYLYGW